MKFDKIIIETSPFIRCVQTAAWIAAGLNVDEVELNLAASEHMSTHDFPDGDPRSQILSLNVSDVNDKDFKKFHYLPEDIKIVNKGKDSGADGIMYPESLQSVQSRAIDFNSEFSRVMQHKDVVQDGKKVCYLVISHGMMVWQMGELAEKLAQNGNQLPAPTQPDITKDQKDKILHKYQAFDWPGYPVLKYLSANAFAVKYNSDE